MFITNGQSYHSESIQIAAADLHNYSTFQVYAIGTAGANVTLLNIITGGNNDFVFYSNTFDSSVLTDIEDKVKKELCAGTCVAFSKHIIHG